MIGAQYYKPIYLFLVLVLTWYNMANVTTKPKYENNTSCLVLTIFMTLFIGFRPVSHQYFVDMYGYAMQFEMWARQTIGFYLDQENLIFDNIRANMATIGLSYTSFFVLIAAIYFGGMYYVCTRMFNSRKIIALLVWLAAFSTFTYGTNGIKAGSAGTVFLVALALYDSGRNILAYLIGVLSIGFHHSMFVPVTVFVVCTLYKKHKIYYYIWIVCFLIALFHITYFQNLFAQLSLFSGDESGTHYLTSSQAIKGFRIDFILYSCVPIVLGWFYDKKGFVISDKYKTLLDVYILTNSIWLLCMYAEFTNRIAYLSWFMYPIVLIYPFLKESELIFNISLMKRVVWGHLAFTLFMEFIYY